MRPNQQYEHQGCNGTSAWSQSALSIERLSLRPNVLGISGGAPVDWDGCWTDSIFQQSDDLVGAERRPLHALVRRHNSYQSQATVKPERTSCRPTKPRG